jgi:hypothetical protein
MYKFTVVMVFEVTMSSQRLCKTERRAKSGSVEDDKKVLQCRADQQEIHPQTDKTHL